MSAPAALVHSQIAQVFDNFSLVGAATTNATVVKAQPCFLNTIAAVNINAAVRYLKFYDKVAAPTVGTDIPVLVVALPPAGVPVVVNFPTGWKFKLGMGIAIVTGITTADATAVVISEQVVSLQFQ